MKKPERLKSNIFCADSAVLFSAVLLLLFFFWANARTSFGYEQTFSPLLRCILLLLICSIAYLGGVLRAQRTNSNKIILPLLWSFLALYLYLLLSFTVLDSGLRLDGTRLTGKGTPREIYLRWFVNFQPFKSIYTVYIQGLFNHLISLPKVILNLLGNLCAMMPLSFFLPCLIKPLRKWYFFLPAVTLPVLIIETTQFWLMVGSCDVDDVILNVGGAMILFFLLKIPPFARFCERIREGWI